MYKLKMNNKLAHIKYVPHTFQILENGDHVICAISGKKIKLDELQDWNVDLQEPYYSYVEASKKREKIGVISIYHVTKSTCLENFELFFPTNNLNLG